MKKLLAFLFIAIILGLFFYFDHSSLFVQSASKSSKNNTVSTSDAPSVETSKARWTSDNLIKHWKKHKKEFPEYKSAAEYGNAALRFFENPPEDTLFKKRSNGDNLYYHPPRNLFGVTTKDGIPKTFFKPNNGIKYWNKQ